MRISITAKVLRKHSSLLFILLVLVLGACTGQTPTPAPRQTHKAPEVTDTPRSEPTEAPEIADTPGFEPVELESDWPAYGGDPGGSRYSPLDQINSENVDNLQVAWTYQTGDASHEGNSGMGGTCCQCHNNESKFEATPILNAGLLYLSTPLNRVIAVNPETGTEVWRYDPAIKLDINRSEGYVSRGVSFWQNLGAEGNGPCSRRVFMGTVDARLFALDAESGERRAESFARISEMVV